MWKTRVIFIFHNKYRISYMINNYIRKLSYKQWSHRAVIWPQNHQPLRRQRVSEEGKSMKGWWDRGRRQMDQLTGCSGSRFQNLPPWFAHFFFFTSKLWANCQKNIAKWTATGFLVVLYRPLVWARGVVACHCENYQACTLSWCCKKQKVK